jgi:hypothetical protein
MFPMRREEELVVRHMPEETLVYDLKRNKAHCLNSAAALVWKHCDGQTSIAQLAERLHSELHIPAKEKVVLVALDRLQRAGLLQRATLPADRPRYSRREMAKLGVAAVVASLVTTVLAPPAHAQGSCLHTNARCPGPNAPGCCVGCICVQTGFQTFQCVGSC